MTDENEDGPPRTVVVSHLLPIHLSRDATGQWSARWDEDISTQGVAISRYLALGVRQLNGPVLFVGSPSIYVPPSERPAVEAAIAAAGIDCALVHLSQRVASRFYQGFCKATLWPTLHNVLDVYNNEKMGAIIDRENTAIDRENISTSPSSVSPEGRRASAASADDATATEGEPSPPAQPWQQTQSWNPIEGQEETWADYCEVNREFARVVVENYSDGDVIWVQHYHLLLTPSYLARKLRNANIGTRRARIKAHAHAHEYAYTHTRRSKRVAVRSRCSYRRHCPREWALFPLSTRAAAHKLHASFSGCCPPFLNGQPIRSCSPHFLLHQNPFWQASSCTSPSLRPRSSAA